jgi:hypothetical protein
MRHQRGARIFDSRSSASGANLPRLHNLNNATSGTIRFFDSTWKATGVDPAAPWENAYYPVGNANRASTQSENSANYVGWKDVPFAQQAPDADILAAVLIGIADPHDASVRKADAARTLDLQEEELDGIGSVSENPGRVRQRAVLDF